MKCQVCRNERPLYWCKTEGGATILACIMCATEFGYKIIEKVKEVKSEAKRHCTPSNNG